MRGLCSFFSSTQACFIAYILLNDVNVILLCQIPEAILTQFPVDTDVGSHPAVLLSRLVFEFFYMLVILNGLVITNIRFLFN